MSRAESDVTVDTSDLADMFYATAPDSYGACRRTHGCTWTRRAPTLEEIDRGEVDE